MFLYPFLVSHWELTAHLWMRFSVGALPALCALSLGTMVNGGQEAWSDDLPAQELRISSQHPNLAATLRSSIDIEKKKTPWAWVVIPYAPKNYLESSTGRDRLKRCDTKRLDSRACSAPPFAYSIPRREKTEEKGGQGTRRRKGRVDPTASGRSPLTDGVVEWVMVEWVAGGSGGLDGDTRGACGRAPPWCGACAS